jgi:hypothetical protein
MVTQAGMVRPSRALYVMNLPLRHQRGIDPLASLEERFDGDFRAVEQVEHSRIDVGEAAHQHRFAPLARTLDDVRGLGKGRIEHLLQLVQIGIEPFRADLVRAVANTDQFFPVAVEDEPALHVHDRILVDQLAHLPGLGVVLVDGHLVAADVVRDVERLVVPVESEGPDLLAGESRVELEELLPLRAFPVAVPEVRGARSVFVRLRLGRAHRHAGHVVAIEHPALHVPGRIGRQEIAAAGHGVHPEDVAGIARALVGGDVDERGSIVCALEDLPLTELEVAHVLPVMVHAGRRHGS